MVCYPKRIRAICLSKGIEKSLRKIELQQKKKQIVMSEHLIYHIKPYLKRRGFNLTALASSMGMSFQRFDHHIKPKEDLSYNFVIELSEKLNISTQELIEQVTIK